jgi:hypothetical protein
VRVAFILTLAAGFAFGLVAVGANLVGRAVPDVQQPTAVVWADRVFTSRHDLALWFAARGSNYGVWAIRHPALARRFEIRLSNSTTGGLEAQSAGMTDRKAGDTRSTLLLIIGSISLAISFAVGVLQALRRAVPHRRLELATLGRRIRAAPALRISAVRARSLSRARAHPRGQPNGLHRPANGPPVMELGKLRAALSPLLSVPLSVPRLFVAPRIPWRKGSDRLVRLVRAGGGSARIAARAVSNRHFRHSLMSIAWYVTTGLLAFAVGAWIAIYLK